MSLEVFEPRQVGKLFQVIGVSLFEPTIEYVGGKARGGKIGCEVTYSIKGNLSEESEDRENKRTLSNVLYRITEELSKKYENAGKNYISDYFIFKDHVFRISKHGCCSQSFGVRGQGNSIEVVKEFLGGLEEVLSSYKNISQMLVVQSRNRK